jgi:hypothetical protein
MSQQPPESRAKREANRAFKPAQPDVPEYAKEQKAFDENRERLKRERLARENSEPEKTSDRKSST